MTESVTVDGRYNLRRLKDGRGITGASYLCAEHPDGASSAMGEVRVDHCVLVGKLYGYSRTTPVKSILSVEDKDGRRDVLFETQNNTYLLTGEVPKDKTE